MGVDVKNTGDGTDGLHSIDNVVVTVCGKGDYQVRTGVLTGEMSAISGKYQNRFDDPQYY